MRFGGSARMRYRALLGRSHSLCIFPDGPGIVIGATGTPFGLARGHLLIAQIYIDLTGLSVDGDAVTVFEQTDRAADRGLRSDMPDAEPALLRRTGHR